jgi:hypothetical protein
MCNPEGSSPYSQMFSVEIDSEHVIHNWQENSISINKIYDNIEISPYVTDAMLCEGVILKIFSLIKIYLMKYIFIS